MTGTVIVHLAEVRRARRARALHRAVLAGGWGVVAQAAAWDRTFPRWRHALAITVDGRDWPCPAVTRQLREILSADGRRLARAWYRLIMQDLGRRAGTGGHPVGTPAAGWRELGPGTTDHRVEALLVQVRADLRNNLAAGRR